MEDRSGDLALEAVLARLISLDPDGGRTAQTLRETYDQLYDGGRTGRYRWDQLYKTEKTHFGTLIEINLQREFDFADGTKLDYEIAGHEVDAKYSHSLAWMLPPEVVGEICLLVSASDERSEFSLGVVRATEDRLNLGENRDAKRTLSAAGRDSIAWLQRGAALPPNVLLQLPTQDVDAIFAQRSGQQKVNELFRRATGTRISRAAIETVARQRDPMKRVRGNGGARSHLAEEGIVILGGDYVWQRRIAVELEMPRPFPGEFVSVYVARATPDWDGPVSSFGDGVWRPATRQTAEQAPSLSATAPPST